MALARDKAFEKSRGDELQVRYFRLVGDGDSRGNPVDSGV